MKRVLSLVAVVALGLAAEAFGQTVIFENVNVIPPYAALAARAAAM